MDEPKVRVYLCHDDDCQRCEELKDEAIFAAEMRNMRQWTRTDGEHGATITLPHMEQ